MSQPTRTCTVEGCDGKHASRGYCNKHYLRWRKHGDPLGGKPGPSVRKAVDFPDGTRLCTGCGQRQVLDQFDKDKNASLGRRSKCKACRSTQMKDLYQRDPERYRGYERARRANEAEHMRGLEKRRYERNREKRIALAVEHTHRRRARTSQVQSDRGISRVSLRRRDGDFCCYCGIQMRFRSGRAGQYEPSLATVEHVIPISLGGTHTWDNVALACWECNIRRGNRPVETLGGADAETREGRVNNPAHLDPTVTGADA